MEGSIQIDAIWNNNKNQIAERIDFDRSRVSILDKIKNTEKEIKRKNIAKTIAIATILVLLIHLVKSQSDISLLSTVGIGMIVLSTIISMVYYWKIQFKTTDLSHDLPQDDFINDSINKMKKQHLLVRKMLMILVLILIAGLNLFYFNLLKDESMVFRIFYHAGFSLFLLMIGFIGIKIRNRKFMNEFQPIINELIELENNNS